MLTRQLARPEDSFFLFGPRGTGKSTLLRQWFPDALWFDLLSQTEMFHLLRSPSYFSEAVSRRPEGSWIVVDEIQKVPGLLDEVHRLIETGRYRFALSGSSARKLKRGGANLLAGRATVTHLYPLSLIEAGPTVEPEDILAWGSLPKILLEREPLQRKRRLRAYVSTYMAEEIKAEAVTRRLDAFGRFLTVAGLANAQVTNLSNIARDAGVPRASVTSYFQILQDTLLGAFLPAWRPRLRIKEVSHPKFYFFDGGVARALTDRLDDRPSPEERGALFETFVFNEIKSALAYRELGGGISYWRTPDGTEVDFIYHRGDVLTAIETKSTDLWKPEFGKGLIRFHQEMKHPVRCLGVYLGKRPLQRNFGPVFPVREFAQRLHRGEFF
jgi:predicted AAA+ superfamily ATPase